MPEPTIPTLFAWQAECPRSSGATSAFYAKVRLNPMLAVIRSQSRAVATEEATMPKWRWGIPGRPYLG